MWTQNTNQKFKNFYVSLSRIRKFIVNYFLWFIQYHHFYLLWCVYLMLDFLCLHLNCFVSLKQFKKYWKFVIYCFVKKLILKETNFYPSISHSFHKIIISDLLRLHFLFHSQEFYIEYMLALKNKYFPD